MEPNLALAPFIEQLLIARVRVEYQAMDACTLPPWLGSTLRGAIGMALRHVACEHPEQDCGDCTLSRTCPYAVLFETSPDPRIVQWQKIEDWPRPLVFEPPLAGRRDWARGDVLEFHLNLFGRAADSWPWIVRALSRAAARGLGQHRAPFRLLRILDAQNPQTPRVLHERRQAGTGGEPARFRPAFEMPGRKDEISIRFLSPTRIKRRGRFVQELPFEVLVRAALGRVSSMVQLHCGGSDHLIDAPAILHAARSITAESNALRRVSHQRYSNRQGKTLQQDGLVGAARYTGPVGPFLPLLHAGTWTHIGKDAVMGLGWYRMDLLGQ